MSSDTDAPSEAADSDANPGADTAEDGFDALPSALTDRDQWVCWREEDRDGDTTKVPVDATGDGHASVSDPDTRTTFDRARDYHADSDTDTVGIGFVFTAEDTVAGVDLDDCRDPDTGQPDDTARDVIGRLDSYTEVSPSGTGYHVYVHGIVPEGGNRRDGVELYDEGRFFTVTGDHVDGTPSQVNQRADALRDVQREYIVRDDATDDESTDADGRNRTGGVDLADDALIEKAENAENGDKFNRLWNGDTSDYPSPSEADQALCCLLAFWTGGDRDRIERLFQRSGLVREKWTEREDYRTRTIDKAVSVVDDYYDPDRDNTDDAPSGHSDAATRASRAADDDAEDGDLRTLQEVYHAEKDAYDATTNPEKAYVAWNVLQREVDVLAAQPGGTLYASHDGVWRDDGKQVLREASHDMMGTDFSKTVLDELVEQVRATAAVDRDELGVPAGTVAVKNGLLDLDTRELRDLRPDDYALTRLPVEYDPDAAYDEWADYVKEWAENGKADALQEYVGYCLHVGAMPIHRALLLVGSGANGKGTFLSVVRALLGPENTTSIELQTLANERDAVADFHGSIANIDDDLSARKLGNGIGMFKKLVGGDRVRGRHLYESGFEFEATGKHLYAANEVPDVSGDVGEGDEAFWRRWLLIEFPNHYGPAERDPDLADRLTEPDRLSGVLNWALDGYDRLLEQGYFTGEQRTAHEKRERWQAWGDSVDKFISECVEHDPDADNKSTTQVHRRYAAWCRENDERPVGQQQLTTTLKNEEVGYSTSVRVDGYSTPQRGYKALRLSDDVPALEDTPDRGRQSRFS